MDDAHNFEERFRRALKSLPDGKKAIENLDDDPSAGFDIPSTIVVEGTEKSAKVTTINLYQQPEAHPVVLDLILLKKYGVEWLHWDVETLIWRVPQDFNTTGISDLNLNKIQAMKALHLNDNYWLQWEVFNWCTQPLNNMFPNFEVMQVPSTAQMLVSVSIAADVRADVAWSEEVKTFIEQACKFDGIFCPQAPLDFVQPIPDNDLLDCEVVRDKWPEVKRTDTMPTGDTILAEQLRRMLDAQRFLLADRQRMQDQMRLVVSV